MQIRYDWEILRVVFLSSCLIVHTTNSSSGPIDQVTYSLLIHYNVSNNTCLSPIIRISYTCKMRIAIPSLFTMYKRQGSYLHFFNSSFRVIFLMYIWTQTVQYLISSRYTDLVPTYHGTYIILWEHMPLLVGFLGILFLMALYMKTLSRRLWISDPTS